MPKVVFVNEKKEIEVPVGANLREEALRAGIPLYRGIHRLVNCRGKGLCGTCRVYVRKGMEHLSPKRLLERIRLAMMPFANIGHENEVRLACQCQVLGDCEIVTRPRKDLYGENFWQKPYPNK
ncbi:MAG: ferredoxin [Gemmataceae bacterium]